MYYSLCEFDSVFHVCIMYKCITVYCEFDSVFHVCIMYKCIDIPDTLVTY